MDLLEKIYEGKIDFKKCVEFSQFKSELDHYLFIDNLHKLANTLKTDEQKRLFNSLESDFQERLRHREKEMFLNGLSCGMKMGLEMNNRFKDFDFDKDAPLSFN